MKTDQFHLPIRNLHENIALIVFLFILLLVSLFQDAAAQAPNQFMNDPYFPGKHKFSAGLLTTYRGSSVAAPVLIGEVNYGVSNRFALGVVGGTTGTLSLIAIKLAARLYQKENFRLLYRMSVIYYLERKGTYLFDQSNRNVMPWILSMGLLDAEWKLKCGVRWSVGMGLLETHCVDGMMNMLLGRTQSQEEKDEDLPLELFNTLQTSVAIPLSQRLILRPEAIVVFQGTQLVTGDQYKVGPLNIYLNLVYHF